MLSIVVFFFIFIARYATSRFDPNESGRYQSIFNSYSRYNTDADDFNARTDARAQALFEEAERTRERERVTRPSSRPYSSPAVFHDRKSLDEDYNRAYDSALSQFRQGLTPERPQASVPHPPPSTSAAAAAATATEEKPGLFASMLPSFITGEPQKPATPAPEHAPALPPPSHGGGGGGGGGAMVPYGHVDPAANASAGASSAMLVSHGSMDAVHPPASTSSPAQRDYNGDAQPSSRAITTSARSSRLERSVAEQISYAPRYLKMIDEATKEPVTKGWEEVYDKDGVNVSKKKFNG